LGRGRIFLWQCLDVDIVLQWNYVVAKTRRRLGRL